MKQQNNQLFTIISIPSIYDYKPFSCVGLKTSFVPSSYEYYEHSFLLGRACAQKALNQIGIQNITVEKSSSGAPIWPKGVQGSITHSLPFAFAIVTNQKNTYLGIDFEPVISNQDLANKICTEEEKSVFLKPIKDKQIYLKTLTAIFSFKESFYKCVYPLVQKYFGFQSISIKYLSFEKKTVIFEILDLNIISILGIKEDQGFIEESQNLIFTAYWLICKKETSLKQLFLSSEQ